MTRRPSTSSRAPAARCTGTRAPAAGVAQCPECFLHAQILSISFIKHKLHLQNRVMPRQIALLRGVNVGGKKKVAMAKLRALTEELGYRDVRTYANSGNVVFSGR